MMWLLSQVSSSQKSAKSGSNGQPLPALPETDLPLNRRYFLW